MLDLKLLQKQPEVVAAALAARHSAISLDEFLDLDRRRRAALADTATQVRRPGPLPGGCPACREMVALLRRQNRLLEELLTAMGVRPE